jgi:hypothetical protein
MEAKDLLKEKWAVWDNHIVTEREWKVITVWKVEYMTRGYIAFNVGKTLAHHIVRLHNQSLEAAQRAAREDWSLSDAALKAGRAA